MIDDFSKSSPEKRIIIDSSVLSFLKNDRQFSKLKSSLISYGKKPQQNLDGTYFVSWGVDTSGVRKGMVETGFFRDAIHIDTVGLYENCSLNLPSTRFIIENFNTKVSAKELFKSDKIQPKIRQHLTNNVSWDGVVLAGQYQNDRSILRVGTSNDYRNFVEESCKYYGKKLFVKMHPVIMGNAEEVDWMLSTAKKYGCEVGNVNLSVIEKSDYVISYNSTFAIDCLLRDKHVIQHAPGYFWQTGVVQYSERQIGAMPTELDRGYIDKFLDFLMWRYCFNANASAETLQYILRTFSKSDELFPLLEEQSYGSGIEITPDKTVEIAPNKTLEITTSKTSTEKFASASTCGGHGNITHVDAGTVDYLKSKFDIQSMIDVGCGMMGMERVAVSKMITYLGVDGDKTLPSKINFLYHDYSMDTFKPSKTFDLGWSVEFVEHVEQAYISNYMATFKKCKYICMTHALPGKFGYHHVNCQLPEYWIRTMSEYGFSYDEKTSQEIRKASTMRREFMRNTGMFFTNNSI